MARVRTHKKTTPTTNEQWNEKERVMFCTYCECMVSAPPPKQRGGGTTRRRMRRGSVGWVEQSISSSSSVSFWKTTGLRGGFRRNLRGGILVSAIGAIDPIGRSKLRTVWALGRERWNEAATVIVETSMVHGFWNILSRNRCYYFGTSLRASLGNGLLRLRQSCNRASLGRRCRPRS